MVIPKEIRQNVINGRILDQDGCWHTIEGALNRVPLNKTSVKETAGAVTEKNDAAGPDKEKIYHNKETDRLETSQLHSQSLAVQTKTEAESDNAIPSDDAPTGKVSTCETDNLDTRHLTVDPPNPDAPDTKLMKLSSAEVDTFDSDIPKNELEDTSELDSVFSEIMSELDVFADDETPVDGEDPLPENSNPSPHDKEGSEVSDDSPETPPEENERPEPTETASDTDETEPQQPEESSSSHVLSDWDKARSKSGKIVLYISAAGAVIAGIVVLVQILL